MSQKLTNMWVGAIYEHVTAECDLPDWADLPSNVQRRLVRLCENVAEPERSGKRTISYMTDVANEMLDVVRANIEADGVV